MIIGRVVSFTYTNAAITVFSSPSFNSSVSSTYDEGKYFKLSALKISGTSLLSCHCFTGGESVTQKLIPVFFRPIPALSFWASDKNKSETCFPSGQIVAEAGRGTIIDLVAKIF